VELAQVGAGDAVAPDEYTSWSEYSAQLCKELILQAARWHMVEQQKNPVNKNPHPLRLVRERALLTGVC
jgi:hypothetical protein